MYRPILIPIPTYTLGCENSENGENACKINHFPFPFHSHGENGENKGVTFSYLIFLISPVRDGMFLEMFQYQIGAFSPLFV